MEPNHYSDEHAAIEAAEAQNGTDSTTQETQVTENLQLASGEGADEASLTE